MLSCYKMDSKAGWKQSRREGKFFTLELLKYSKVMRNPRSACANGLDHKDLSVEPILSMHPLSSTETGKFQHASNFFLKIYSSSRLFFKVLFLLWIMGLGQYLHTSPSAWGGQRPSILRAGTLRGCQLPGVDSGNWPCVHIRTDVFLTA